MHPNQSPSARFAAAEQFSGHHGNYQLAPFRFARIPAIADRILLVNEVGEFHFLSNDQFVRFQSLQLNPNEDLYRDLRSKHFLLDQYAEAFWPYAVSQYRTRKSFIAGGPALHIVVVTLRCDHSCPYCQVSRQTVDAARFDMDANTANLVVERILESPGNELKVEFQGGESLLGFARIRQLVDAISRRAVEVNKAVEYVIATTLNELSDEHLEFFKAHRVSLSTSVDGPAWLHNKNRPRQGKNSFERTVAGIRRVREVLGHDSVSALVTLTRESLDHPEAIIDTYVELGFPTIFLRALSQYGFARKTNERIGYPQSRFLEFYDRALEHILKVNQKGTALEETYTALLMRRILTPYATGYVDLSSPTGAMFGALAYNYDGGVFASDEGRMLAEAGDLTFRLGDVSQPRDVLFASPNARAIAAASIAEALPGCSDCAFVPYCGSDPVGNHAETGSMVGHRPTSTFCHKHTALFHRLFTHLTDPSSATSRMLASWAFGRPMAESPRGHEQ
jgi:His-Xaa-Ser system radical SAM maturase HxsB